MTAVVVTKHPRYGNPGQSLAHLEPWEQRRAVASGYARDEAAPEVGTFDPSQHTAEQVVAHLDAAFARNDRAELERVLNAEQDGKARATVEKWVDAHVGTLGTE